MKIGILGTGGVGGYFGAKLAHAGNEVKFIARGKHLQAIKESGLFVKSTKGDIHIKSAKASDDIHYLSDCEMVILGTKAWQVKQIAPALAKTVSKETIILPLQNGVMALEELAEYFDRNQILGGLCMIFSSIEAPGIINHKGLEPLITFGEIDKSVKERTLHLKNIFERADIGYTLSLDIESAIWRKFILICLSGLGAITNSGYGLLRETPETRQIMVDVLTEVSLIAKAKNVNLKTDIVQESLQIVDSYPAESMSSLARDVINGNPSEIEYQNGTVVRLGKEVGIDTPANRFIYSFVKLIEKKRYV